MGVFESGIIFCRLLYNIEGSSLSVGLNKFLSDASFFFLLK